MKRPRPIAMLVVAATLLAGLVVGGCEPTGREETARAAESSDLHAEHAGHAGTGQPTPEAITASRESEIAYYTCSMHPSVRAHEPGKCPICGMTLVPVSRAEAATGTIVINEAERRQVGIATSLVERRSLTKSIRTVATVAYDEKLLRAVTLKVGGWVTSLEVDETGVRIERGQPLMTFYSPDLYTAQLELLQAVKSLHEASLSGLSERGDYLVKAARQKLRLWDVPDERIAQIERNGEPFRDLPIVAPTSGYVVDKAVVQGDYVAPGATLYRIAGLDKVWIQAEVYEGDFELMRVGQPARIELPYAAGESYDAHVAYVYPYMDARTRTGTVRIELANDPGRPVLKPDMYATVTIDVDLGERLAVPASAVVYTGPRRLVFVDHGEGRLTPTEIRTGLRADDYYEVLEGLQAGDRIVTAGNFLVASESRIRSAEQHWGGAEHGDHGGH